MRSVAARALIFIMLLQAAGYLFVFEIQKLEIRREIKLRIKAGVPEAELVLVKVSAGQVPPALQRIRADEFRIAGKRYDIVWQKSHGGTVWYYCLADEKETQLFANLEELVKREMSQNARQQQRRERLLSLFTLLFFCSKEEAAAVPVAAAMAWSAHRFGLQVWIATPSPPPPEARVFTKFLLPFMFPPLSCCAGLLA